MNITLIGESTDSPCNPTRETLVVKTKYNGFKLAADGTWDSWEMGIVFPDAEKAKFFIENFKSGMHDYREGMEKGTYPVHILQFKYPKPAELYADEIQMSPDFLRY